MLQNGTKILKTEVLQKGGDNGQEQKQVKMENKLKGKQVDNFY